MLLSASRAGLVKSRPELAPNSNESDLSFEETMRCDLNELPFTVIDDRHPKEIPRASGPEQQRARARPVELGIISRRTQPGRPSRLRRAENIQAARRSISVIAVV